ncbi:phosphatase PAP2 family protein [Adhaeribacter radiodurans]|uniref:Phosphatase PAP2 family protein n=1 Tax=Adhaeribacter radiodurans TaxID=2745197 RepID=A0A7L7LFM2_9BACT|nr:phosphatase PAP2 family protein [Adhaeribacter radiodurans]QMU31315.1 phosphatase PAP2 family protein [Adhaeribacter radiodurans]
MKNQFLLVIVFFQISLAGFSQAQSPYKTSFKVDAPIVGGGVAISGLGLYLISNKHGLEPNEIANLTKADVNAFDRFTAGNYSESANNFSDVPLYTSFALPLALIIDKKAFQNGPQILLLYTETMAVTGSIYAMTAGLVYRKRPLVYGTEAPLRTRTTKNANNSFFAGHVAATASATFFVAKVFSDFNPDSRLRPVVWGVAAALPASVSYLRLKAGKHFLSDVLLGYGIGTTVGILVPHLHKKNNQSGFSITPTYNRLEGNGVALSYTFK